MDKIGKDDQKNSPDRCIQSLYPFFVIDNDVIYVSGIEIIGMNLSRYDFKNRSLYGYMLAHDDGVSIAKGMNQSGDYYIWTSLDDFNENVSLIK
jgi:hypothetical protein